MKKTLNSIIIALLILSNLYTLKNLQDFKQNSKTFASSVQSKKEDPLKTMQISIESFAVIINEQKEIISKLIQDSKEGWETHSQNIKNIYQQLVSIEKEIERLKELRSKLEDDIKKQQENK
jgi:hypothetical protein